MQDMIFQTLVILFGLTLAINLIFRFLKLPIILGYLVIGMLAGPEMMGLIEPAHFIDEVAEIGLVFLLFGIGLEFSANKLWEMRSGVFLYGGGQVLISVLSCVFIGILLKVSIVHSLIIGGVVAMSSTAVVSKILAEKKEFGFQYGRDMIAILLMQDILVVPFLVLIPLLPSVQHVSQLLPNLLSASAKGIVLIILMNIIGRFILKPIFTYIARASCDELFMLMTLFVVIVAAWLSFLLKLSLTLGAFLAGMLLSETAYRHKIASEIRPFQDVFLGIFFVSVGMHFNFHTMLLYWHWLLLMLVGLMVGKALLIYLLGIGLGRSKKNALMTSLRLAHGGEFGFALLALTQKYILMPESYIQVLLAGILFSLVIGIVLNHILPLIFKQQSNMSQDLWALSKENASVMLCGFGRVGRAVGRVLKENGVPYFAIDINLNRVERAIQDNHPVYFADASLREIGYVIRDLTPKCVMICFSEEAAVMATVKQIQVSGYQGDIIARTFDNEQAERLKALGVQIVVPEIAETVYVLLDGLLKKLEFQESAIGEILASLKIKKTFESS